MTAPSAALAPIAAEMNRELAAILDWWSTNAVDEANGGFHGEIDAENNPTPNAHKGAVLNARILWFMSEAARVLKNARAGELANRAAEYFEQHFIDPVHGGVFWALDAAGAPAIRKKQTYAQSFAIYAFVAYYNATRRIESLTHAKRLFSLIEARAKAPEHGGYVEALGEDWSPIADVRLSEVDANAPKSMNTHLHVLEGYTALHAVDPTPQTRAALRASIEIFLKHIVGRTRWHLRLFFDHDWTPLSEAISFGHDVEASWLLWEACEALGDIAISQRAKPVVICLAERSLEEALWSDGSLINERVSANGHADTTRVWWVQAEALVGYLNAYELSGNAAFIAAIERVWRFIMEHHKDKTRGEWTWRSDQDPVLKTRAYKAGFWKGPYHNGRALLECRARIAKIVKQ